MGKATGQRLETLRRAAGLSQSELARRAGLSRQAMSAIEAGTYQPGVAVALRLARILASSVEELFGDGVGEAPSTIEALWEGGAPIERGRVALGRVAGQVVALALPPAQLRLPAAPGFLVGHEKGAARIETFRSNAEIDATLLIAGCDPAAAFIGDSLARERRAETAQILLRSSAAALAAMLEGRVHVAGVHLGGDDNLVAVEEILAGRCASVLVHFARWEVGLATPAGNPLGIAGLHDLARPDLRFATREPGAGVRVMIDQRLASLGITPVQAIESPGHLEVAALIAQGQADLGVTLRVAAVAYGLHFIALREERYDLVIPEREFAKPPVKAFLETLNAPRFAREVGELCAYDTTDMGRILGRIG
ncbi:MAG TPA: substrate-binding domain-containing protein [Stellaceae bacterium]|nr:substrate-binding domain-containing protein [Stellaceae bacterium]